MKGDLGICVNWERCDKIEATRGKQGHIFAPGRVLIHRPSKIPDFGRKGKDSGYSFRSGKRISDLLYRDASVARWRRAF